MKKKIVKFFWNNRIIDSHIGIWKFHIWVYFLATYFSFVRVFNISIYFRQFCIFKFRVDFNSTDKLFDFGFKILNIGYKTDKGYFEDAHKSYEEYKVKREKAFKEFKKNLTTEEINKAKQYCRLK